MKGFLLLLSLLAVLLQVYGEVNNCFFGWTQDEDDDPYTDWIDPCINKETTRCQGASCRGANAICFKIRYQGTDDQILSLYGCVDDYNNPTDDHSWIPAGLTANELELRKLDDEDDVCVTESEAAVPTIEGATSIGGEEDVTGQWCTCTDDACNSGNLAKIASSLLFVALVVLVAV